MAKAQKESEQKEDAWRRNIVKKKTEVEKCFLVSVHHLCEMMYSEFYLSVWGSESCEAGDGKLGEVGDSEAGKVNE
jgi:hypothetical protein